MPEERFAIRTDWYVVGAKDGCACNGYEKE
jgi:hypothetical protein